MIRSYDTFSLSKDEDSSTAEPDGITARADGLKEYKAFIVRDRQPECLEIWSPVAPTYMIDYRYFQQLTCNGAYGTELIVFFSFVGIKISGRLMTPLITAIRDKRCAALYCFHPEEYAAPAAQATIIESIDLLKRKDKATEE